MALPSHDLTILIVGPSVSGKSTLALGLMERLTERGHQICVVDPEGDYEAFGEVKYEVKRVRNAAGRVVELLALPSRNVCVDLLGLPMAERPRFGADLLAGITELQRGTARPHWLVLDEAHHFFPFESTVPPERPPGLVLITVDIGSVSQALLNRVDVVIATGARADETIRTFHNAVGGPVPRIPPTDLEWGECLVSIRASRRPPFPVRVVPTRTKHRRHRRKYDVGTVGDGRGFAFKDRWEHEHGYAPNLSRFTELAFQVGDESWFLHLHQGDYERWFREVIKDDDLADEAARIKAEVESGAPVDSRNLLRSAIVERYAGPH